MSVEGEGQKYAPWGFAGGCDGTPSTLIFRDRAGKETVLPSKVPYKKTNPGETLEIIGPCGGGYGSPFERDPEAVLGDVLDDYITSERARNEFGVVIEDNKILWDETELLRSTQA
ncbi:hydantoinase B/oxoprolinase family protein [Sporolactobacillus inulinus]|uniref:hydantoinase B/oxoprolinase family protein n=1 Tax=Sporolactobacillus inulinus TaxID=2078 RepID=UPI0021CCB459|nr:hydantoinase B/oxoprolinase family protein [Sporolactobacillus inulinus]